MKGLEVNKLVLSDFGHAGVVDSIYRVEDQLRKWSKSVKVNKVNRHILATGVMGLVKVNIYFGSYFSDSWKHVAQSRDFDEIYIFNGRRSIDNDGEGLLQSRLRDEKSPFPVRNFLHYSLVNENGKSFSAGGRPDSLSEVFYFPVTMYRLGMEDNWEDPENPTPEEFLVSLMMEGVHAATDEEKAAIEKAKVYVEGKDNGSDQG